MRAFSRKQFEDEICSCCNNKISNYSGQVEENGTIVSDYWLRIPEGHGGHFTLGIGVGKPTKPLSAVLIGEATTEGITYWVQDPDNSPWSEIGEYGIVLSREEILENPAKELIFKVADTIAAQDERLLPHVTKYTNQA